MRVLVKDAFAKTGENVELKGWVHRIRNLGKVVFVILRDRTGMIQLVFESDPFLTHECVISATGLAASNDRAPGGVEVQVKDLTVIARAEADLPIPVNQEPDKLSIDTILDNRMISIRNPKIRAIFELQSAILEYFASHMRSEGFTEIKTSKLIGTGTEGGTGLFSVDYFDTKVFLAQSPQFYKQAMISSGLERVFEIGCAYRAEKHDTPRHLNEYVSLDVEMAFIDSEKDLIDLEKRILKTLFREINERNREQLEAWNASVPDPSEVDSIPTVSYDDAKAVISRETGKRTFDINPEGERVLCDWALGEHGIEAVFVNDFPRKARPFYAYPAGQKTMSFDLLFRGLEITTGGRRINEYGMMLESLPKFGLTPESLSDYIQIFKYGCPPHGGFAVGLERLTQKILGLSNVKEASLFPRDRKRVRP